MKQSERFVYEVIRQCTNPKENHLALAYKAILSSGAHN